MAKAAATPDVPEHHRGKAEIRLGEGSVYAANRAKRKARAAEAQARRDRIEQVSRDRKQARRRMGVD